MRSAAIGCLAAIVLTACSPRAVTPPPADPDPERARAALATLFVDNQTGHQLHISYRIAGRATGHVGIGRVDAASSAEMAPVPAGEPLILIARTAAGAELILPPRTLAIDGAWTWRVDRSARFVQPPRESR